MHQNLAKSAWSVLGRPKLRYRMSDVSCQSLCPSIEDEKLQYYKHGTHVWTSDLLTTSYLHQSKASIAVFPVLKTAKLARSSWACYEAFMISNNSFVEGLQ